MFVVQEDLASKLVSCEDDNRKYADELEQMKVHISYVQPHISVSLLIL